MASRSAVSAFAGAGFVGSPKLRHARKDRRVIFGVSDGQMVLLHGFIKKTQKTPRHDIDLALKRMKGEER